MKKILQIFLIIILFLFSFLFYSNYIKPTQLPEKVENNEKILQENKNNLIKNLKYNVKFDDNTEYSISAELSELIYEQSIEMVYMRIVSAELINRENISLTIKSRKAKYNKKKLAISTSTSRDNVTLLLRSCLNENPEDVFSFISTRDLVEKKKPSPDLYKLVLAKMNVMPEECLAFEDSRIGLVSAKRANIKTAVNPSQYSMGDNFDEADYFLTSFLLEQFPKSLRKRLAL